MAKILFPTAEKMKIMTIIKLPTLMNSGIVCRKELKIMYNLFAFFKSLSTLHTLNILMTESYVANEFLKTVPRMPPPTTTKSKTFQPL